MAFFNYAYGNAPLHTCDTCPLAGIPSCWRDRDKHTHDRRACLSDRGNKRVDDKSAFLREQLRHGLPHAVAAACDDGDFNFQHLTSIRQSFFGHN